MANAAREQSKRGMKSETRLAANVYELGRRARMRPYGMAVRNRRERSADYREVASELRKKNLFAQASQCRLLALREGRVAERMELHLFKWLGSWLLDFLANYGERPSRVVSVYIVAVVAFAAEIYFLGHAHGRIPDLLSAMVFSITSFHGRGFFPSATFNLNDAVTVCAAIEAVFGLFTEGLFVAAFSRRFLDE